jgi:hypothetical protein
MISVQGRLSSLQITMILYLIFYHSRPVVRSFVQLQQGKIVTPLDEKFLKAITVTSAVGLRL